MIYEVKVQYKKMDDDGMEKLFKDAYAVEDFELFAEVEGYMQNFFDIDNIHDFDVTDIKRSRIKEVANAREDEHDKVFMAEVKDVFHKDDGTEKDIKYKILFFAKDFDAAKVFICEYIKQGYSMALIGLKETKFMDILHC